MIYDQDFAATSNEIDYEYIDWQQPYPYWKPFESSQDAQLPPSDNAPLGEVEPPCTGANWDWDCGSWGKSSPWDDDGNDWPGYEIPIPTSTSTEPAPDNGVAEIPLADEVIEWKPAWTTGYATYNKKYDTVCAPFPNNAPPSNVRYVGNIGSQCPPDEVCIMAEPYLVGSFTENERYLLEQGVPVALTSSADIYQEVRIDHETGRLVLWEATRSINCYDLSPFRKVFSWSLNTIPTAQIASENAPIFRPSGDAVLSDAQLAELANGSRVYVDESLYYEYTPATDTLRLINEIDGSVVKQGTFETVLQVNKDGSAVSGGSGILLALGVVGIALSMSNRKSK